MFTYNFVRVCNRICCFCNYCPFSLLTATALMVANVTLTGLSHGVLIQWSRPYANVSPMLYRIKYSCKLLCDNIPYKFNTLLRSSKESNSSLVDLLPGSGCVITFHAIYNPATLDTGLSRTGATLYSSTCKHEVMPLHVLILHN